MEKNENPYQSPVSESATSRRKHALPTPMARIVSMFFLGTAAAVGTFTATMWWVATMEPISDRQQAMAFAVRGTIVTLALLGIGIGIRQYSARRTNAERESLNSPH
jgi:hypothetical protein